jgi:hypothetical protein
VLEKLIYKKLCSISELTSALATYKEQPAIFYGMAPEEDAAGWSTAKYPRIVYFINSKYNAERSSSGLLLINLLCSAENTIMPDDFSDIIIGNLSELFFVGETTTTCSLWNRTDSFKQLYMGSFEQPYTSITSGTEESKIICRTHTFDLIEFPPEISTNPDPIVGLNEWMKVKFPQCSIIGQDILSETWKAQDSTPAIYWRTKAAISELKTTYSVAWVQATMVCHVISDSPVARRKWISEIVNRLSIEGEIALSDKSPMIITHLEYNANGNPIIDGQITVLGTYGILRRDFASIKLQNINL